MESNSELKLGKFILRFSIVSSSLIVGINIFGGIRDSQINSSLTLSLSSLIMIISSIVMKKKYPIYYKYQMISSIIILLAIVFFDIIPRYLIL